jgi:hypothetical protein
MVPLGYGKYARAADIVALIPIDDDARGHGRRTYVHVAGLHAPIVASRSEAAILADMERAANVAAAHGGAPAFDGRAPVASGGRVRHPRRWRRPARRRVAAGAPRP